MFESKVDKIKEHFMFDKTQFYLVIKNGVEMLRYQYIGIGEFTVDILLKDTKLSGDTVALEKINNNIYPASFVLEKKFYNFHVVIKKTRKDEILKGTLSKRLFGILPVSWVYFSGNKNIFIRFIKGLHETA